MPSVTDLSAPYGNFMLGPRAGAAVCEVCFDLTDGHSLCYGCANTQQWLDAVLPISYSIGHEQLHHALACYKRQPPEVAHRFELELAAVLWRHLAVHEACLAVAAESDGFEIVTTVPSSSEARDEVHPLQRIVGELVGPTRDRYERLLRRSSAPAPPRILSLEKFKTARNLHHQSVLLIDDTWTTGANAQSAAAALKMAGAGTVAAVVIGRHLNRYHGDNDRRLRGLPGPFDWTHCAVHPAPDTHADNGGAVSARRQHAV
jgi:predicted amidophosphoribosyltransferase